MGLRLFKHGFCFDIGAVELLYCLHVFMQGKPKCLDSAVHIFAEFVIFACCAIVRNCPAEGVGKHKHHIFACFENLTPETYQLLGNCKSFFSVAKSWKRKGQSFGASVYFALHKGQGVWQPLYWQIVYAGKLKVSLDLGPKGRVWLPADLRPGVNQGAKGRAVVWRGRGEGLNLPSFVFASFADSWDYLTCNPVCKLISFRLVGAES